MKLKPNGKPMGVFVVSIHDGYCEYSYDLKPGKDCSIWDVWKKISKAFKQPRLKEGIKRTP